VSPGILNSGFSIGISGLEVYIPRPRVPKAKAQAKMTSSIFSIVTIYFSTSIKKRSIFYSVILA
jgi:hypothetical protein